MAIDPYGPCPCGSGKKIKFCCGDLAADIERVVRMISGEQRIAAMGVLNRLLEKYPDRIALLDLKSGLAMSLEQTEDAEDAIGRILAVQPQNPHALARRAIFLARAEQSHEAVASLQEAVGPLQGEIPHAVLEAFLHVGLSLHRAGHILAAKAHFQVHMRAQPPESEDHRAVSALVQLHQYGGLPLLVRDDLRLQPCRADVDWSGDFTRACFDAAHGAWASAVRTTGSAGVDFRERACGRLLFGSHPRLAGATRGSWSTDCASLPDSTSPRMMRSKHWRWPMCLTPGMPRI